jgi:hypothetical protein
MERIQSASELKAAIQQLEAKRVEEGRELKRQFEITYESIKPVNLIKSTFKEVIGSTEIKGNMAKSVAGFAVGFLVNKLIFRGSSGPLRKLLGTVVIFGVTNVVTKHADSISNVGITLFNRFLRKKKYIEQGNELTKGM